MAENDIPAAETPTTDAQDASLEDQLAVFFADTALGDMLDAMASVLRGRAQRIDEDESLELDDPIQADAELLHEAADELEATAEELS